LAIPGYRDPGERYGPKAEQLLALYRGRYPGKSPFLIQAQIATDAGGRRSAILQAERKSMMSPDFGKASLLTGAEQASRLRFVNRSVSSQPVSRLVIATIFPIITVVIQELRHDVSGLIAVTPEGGKQARAHAVSPQVESGNVYLPHPALAHWVADFMEEAAAFPHGRNDDQVDAMTQALNRLRNTSASYVLPEARITVNLAGPSSDYGQGASGSHHHLPRALPRVVHDRAEIKRLGRRKRRARNKPVRNPR
jgi:hypothetical protein